MEPDESVPKEEVVKCLTAKVTYLLFRKSRHSKNLSSLPIQKSTTPLILSTNLDFLELSVNVATITGGNQIKLTIVVTPSISYSIQLSWIIHIYWQRMWTWTLKESHLSLSLGLFRTSFY